MGLEYHKGMTVPRQAKDPRARQRARTRGAIVEAAQQLTHENGDVPSVAEAAEAAEVGRTTAYRYFPTQGTLLWALVQEVLAPSDMRLTADDPVARIDEAIEQTFDLVREAEPLMRAQVRLAMDQWARAQTGDLTEEPIPRGGRRRIIDEALEPLEGKMDRARLRRLKAALAAVTGIEARIVFRDICGLSEREAFETARWTARTAVQQAMAEEAAEKG